MAGEETASHTDCKIHFSAVLFLLGGSQHYSPNVLTSSGHTSSNYRQRQVTSIHTQTDTFMSHIQDLSTSFQKTPFPELTFLGTWCAHHFTLYLKDSLSMKAKHSLYSASVGKTSGNNSNHKPFLLCTEMKSFTPNLLNVL